MSTIKDRFDEMNIVPDEQVWGKIQSTMAYQKIVSRRRAIIASSVSVLAVAGAIWAFAVSGNDDTTVVADNTLSESAVVLRPSSDNGAQPVTNDESVLEVSSSSEGTIQVSTSPSVVTVETAPSFAEQPATITTDFVKETDELVVDNCHSTATDGESNTYAIQSGSVATVPVASARNELAAQDNNTDVADNKVNISRDKATSDELVVWIPNAFSPDDPVDDKVRLFKVYPNNDANILSYEIYIYSRGGRVVYHSKDINEGWDGVSRGHAQPMGTYVYVIQINDAVKGLQHHKGTITLLR